MGRTSRYCRKFHDPWGNKSGNQFGSPIRYQYMVGKSTLSNRLDEETESNPHQESYFWDKSKYWEHTDKQFVRTSRRSVERLRR